jgi:hypothetical protein
MKYNSNPQINSAPRRVVIVIALVGLFFNREGWTLAHDRVYSRRLNHVTNLFVDIFVAA